MALIICPECGKEISDKASTCIHCGFPLSESNFEQKVGIAQDYAGIEPSTDESDIPLKASSHVHSNEAPVAKTSFKKKHFIIAALLLVALCFEFTRSILFLVALVCIPISIILIIIKAIAKKPKKIAVILLIASILIVIAYGMTNSHVHAGYNDAYTESTGENSIVGEWTGNSLSIYGDDFPTIQPLNAANCFAKYLFSNGNCRY